MPPGFKSVICEKARSLTGRTGWPPSSVWLLFLKLFAGVIFVAPSLQTGACVLSCHLR